MKRQPLSETHPKLAAQAVGWDPRLVTYGSKKQLEWRCVKKHIFTSSPNSRTSKNTGCYYCSNRRVLVGFNDLKTLIPELAAQAVGWDPTSVAPFSSKTLEWLCTEGHTYFATVANRATGHGCGICAGKTVLPGFNDLKTLFPELAAQADGWDPTTVTSGSHKKTHWKCASGHGWVATVKNRVNGNGCPKCSGRERMVGFNDIATLYPELAAQAVGWDPSSVAPNANKKYLWVCKLGHEYLSPPSGRVRGEGCSTCAGKTVLSGFNDFASRFPKIAEEAVGWDPSTVSFSSNKKYQWRCQEGHQWKASPNARNRGEGCPSCAVGGFDPNKDGWLYFIRQESWGLLQIGISNIPEVRLQTHAASNWEVIEVRGPMPGDITHQWEQDILHALKRRGIKLSPEHIAGKFSGYTEAWVQVDFPAKSLTELIQLVHDDEAQN